MIEKLRIFSKIILVILAHIQVVIKKTAGIKKRVTFQAQLFGNDIQCRGFSAPVFAVKNRDAIKFYLIKANIRKNIEWIKRAGMKERTPIRPKAVNGCKSQVLETVTEKKNFLNKSFLTLHYKTNLSMILQSDLQFLNE